MNIDSLIAKHFTDWKCQESRCDGVKITQCGACGELGHANCYGRFINGTKGEIQTTCEEAGHRPSYSTDISAAWEVFTKTKGLEVISRDDEFPNSWIVGSLESGKEILAKAETAPIAICLAALKLKGIEYKS